MAEKTLRVRLMCATPEPTKAIALGGRLCYSDADIGQIYDAMGEKGDAFVARLTAMGHLSPLEHASFTFGIDGVSRALLAQITRHRIASFSVQSQRYVAKDQLDYVLPPSIAALGEDAAAEFRADMDAAFAAYDKWRQRGIPLEDARFTLPNAAETRMIVTMNARELIHFFQLRCCMRAQWEIRRLAWCMLGIARRESPALFSAFGPGCVKGGCPEGNKTCGRGGDVAKLNAAFNEFLASKPDDDAIRDWVLANVLTESH